MAMAAYSLDAFSAQAEGLSGLCFVGNLDLSHGVERGNLNFAAKGCRSEADRHFTMQVVLLALKHSMWLEVNLHVQVTGRAAVDTMFAFAREPDAITFIDPGRYLHSQCFVLFIAAGTMTRSTRIGYESTGTMAFGASLLD